MSHHGMSKSDNILDKWFGSSIVVMTSNFTVLDSLPLCVDFLHELFGSIDTIVRRVIFDLNSCTQCFSFKLQLKCAFLLCYEGNLIVDTNLTGCCITEQSPSFVLLRGDLGLVVTEHSPW
jgi:hypothetical protein